MKHTLSEQYKVTQEMRRTIKVLIENGLIGTDNANRVDSVLNDIGSTIASLNLTKDIVDKGREEYFNSNYQIFNTYMETDSLLVENSLKETFLKQSYDEIAKAHARIKELQEALKETLYNELPQSLFERIEQLLKQD